MSASWPQRETVRERRAIGGEFALETTTGAAIRQPSLRARLHQLGHGEVTLFVSGRSALRAWLRRLVAGGVHTVAVPAYICDSVVQAARDAGTRWSVEFLPVTSAGEPHADAVVDLARRVGPRGCLLAIPLFGYAYSAPLDEALDTARSDGLVITWDLTHALLSDWASHCAAPSVSSLRKWCGLPDGGALLGAAATRDEPSLVRSAPPAAATAFAETRRQAMASKRDWLAGAPGSEDDFLDALRTAEHLLEAGVDVAPISAVSADLLGTVCVPAMVARRRRNARVLLDGLRDARGIQLLHAELPADVCPFGVPVLLDQRDRIRSVLAAQRVFCAVHWPVPAAVPGERSQTARALAGRLLTLPCDQRYAEEDMARLVRLLRQAVQA